jgi:hypothetical protein
MSYVMDDDKLRSIEVRLQNLESQLTSPEVQPLDSKDKPETVSKLAETSFKTILDADIHLDNKASRILTAMAFLTAAAASTFSKIYTPNSLRADIRSDLLKAFGKYHLGTTAQKAIMDTLASKAQSIEVLGTKFEWIPLTFFLYLFFTLFGAAFCLLALGPSLNIPFLSFKANKKKPHESSSIGEPVSNRVADVDAGLAEPHESSSIDEPVSRLFFEKVAQVQRDEWRKYWLQFPRSGRPLEDAIRDDFIYECHLIAAKTRNKYSLLSWGSFAFKASIVCFAAFITNILLPSTWVMWFATKSFTSLIIFLYILMAWSRPSRGESILASILGLFIAIGSLFKKEATWRDLLDNYALLLLKTALGIKAILLILLFLP